MTTGMIEGFGLSPQQKRLWLLQQRNDSPYRAQCAVRLRGRLDAEALLAALRQIVAAHEILRTTFRSVPGMKFPVQVLADGDALFYREMDLSHLSEASQEAAIEARYEEERRTAFDYAKGPLVRASLLKRAAQEHVMLLSLPALCADKRTLAGLLKELSLAYAARVEASGEGKGPESDAVQYADFSEWQNELLSEADGEITGEAERQRDTASFGPLTALGSRPGLEGLEGLASATEFKPRSTSPLALSATQTEGIGALVRTHGASLPAFFLACWQTLIWRLTGKSEVVVGGICDASISEELEGTLGLFARYFPLACRFAVDARFGDILAQADAALGNAYEWQQYFMWEQRAVTNQGTDAPPFPQLAFEFEQRAEPLLPARAHGLSFEMERRDVCTDRFEIKLNVVRAADCLAIEFHYDAELFKEADIRRLGSYFSTLVREILDQKTKAAIAAAPVGQLQILEADERRRLLAAWRGAKTKGVHAERCLHHLFEAQVQRTPDAVALVFDGQQVSYRSLNGRANRLARHLKNLGAGPEVRVGVCVERSIEMVVCALAVMKAGGAYVPLDAGYPVARLSYMLEDAGAHLLLTVRRRLEGFQDFAGTILCLDDEQALFEEEEETAPEVNVMPDNLAYVVYTSGSTGMPKGVLATHRGAVNYLDFIVSAYGIDGAHRALQLAPLSFDASVRDLFGPLAAGATVVIPNGAEAFEPLALLRKIREQSITAIPSIVPTMLRGLCEAVSAGEAPYDTVKTVLVSGERLYLSDWRRARELFGAEVSVVNQYGPTECTMTSSYAHVGEAQAMRDTALIGRPIANAHFYLLDAHRNPVPANLAGEIFIGGVGLARGYNNRPDLTAERFIPDPFSDEAGARMYLTGDEGRCLADGGFEYLGRLDEQVKLRGIRIEPGEVEAVLSRHAAVRETAVVAREDSPGDVRLVAYVVKNQGATLSASELRSFLGEHLPAHMIPSAFVNLNALPRTPNGKADRRALPAPDQSRPELEGAYVAPRTPAEEEMAEIWAEVLGLERVGVHDDFFDLGGHSLLAIKLVSRVVEIFQVDVPLISLFEARTVCNLAVVVTELQLDQEGDEETARLLEELSMQPGDISLTF